MDGLCNGRVFIFSTPCKTDLKDSSYTSKHEPRCWKTSFGCESFTRNAIYCGLSVLVCFWPRVRPQMGCFLSTRTGLKDAVSECAGGFVCFCTFFLPIQQLNENNETVRPPELLVSCIRLHLYLLLSLPRPLACAAGGKQRNHYLLSPRQLCERVCACARERACLCVCVYRPQALLSIGYKSLLKDVTEKC